MKQVDTKMPKTVPVLTRVSPEVKAKLKTLAKDTKRSESFLAAEAITGYVETHAWQVELIEKRLAKANSPAARFVPHEEVMDWFDSLGTDKPLPKPKGRRLSEL